MLGKRVETGLIAKCPLEPTRVLELSGLAPLHLHLQSKTSVEGTHGQ